MAPPLGLDFKLLSEINRKKMVHILEEIHGTMDLVIDSDVMKPLDTFIQGATTLKQHGVKKIFKLSRDAPVFGEKQRAYLLRADLAKVKWFCDHARASVDSQQPGVYHLILSPRTTHAVRVLLEEEGLFGLVTVWELNPGFLVLDEDFLSMELPEVFPECFVHGDQVNLFPLARALCELQQLFGRIPHVFGHGRFSSKVRSLMEAFWSDAGATSRSQSSQCEIGFLFLFDRDVDYPSVLLTQLTYAGLLDEVFGLNCGVLEFSPLSSNNSEENKDKGPVKMALNAATPPELRDAHFSTVGATLGRQIKELGAKQTPKPDISVQEMKKLVKEELRIMQAERKRLSDHVAASEIITKRKGARFQEQLGTEHACVEGVEFRASAGFIDDAIACQSDVAVCFRLLCLYCYCQGGLTIKEANLWKTRFLHAFGYEQLSAFAELKRCGLWVETGAAGDLSVSMSAGLGVNLSNMSSGVLSAVSAVSPLPRVVSGSSSGFRSMAKRLALVPVINTPLDPASSGVDFQDPAYVFGGGYTPTTLRVVESVIKCGKMTPLVEDALRWLPGDTFPSSSSTTDNVRFCDLPASAESASRVALVVFVGGVTYAELAAFRLLGRKMGKRFVIATTHVTNGNCLVKSILA